MGIKINKIFFLLFFLVLSLISTTYASEVADLVRVGITDNKFQNVLRHDVKLYATAEASICDKQTRKILINIPPNTDNLVKNSIAGLEVSINGNISNLKDFVIISPSGLLGIRDLKRKGLPALYHGAF